MPQGRILGRLGLVGLVVVLVGLVWVSVGAWGSSRVGAGVVVVEDAVPVREGGVIVFPVKVGPDVEGALQFRVSSADSSASLGTDFRVTASPRLFPQLEDGWYRMTLEHHAAYYVIVMQTVVDEVFEGREDVVLEVKGESGLEITYSGGEGFPKGIIYDKDWPAVISPPEPESTLEGNQMILPIDVPPGVSGTFTLSIPNLEGKDIAEYGIDYTIDPDIDPTLTETGDRQWRKTLESGQNTNIIINVLSDELVEGPEQVVIEITGNEDIIQTDPPKKPAPSPQTRTSRITAKIIEPTIEWEDTPVSVPEGDPTDPDEPTQWPSPTSAYGKLVLNHKATKAYSLEILPRTGTEGCPGVELPEGFDWADENDIGRVDWESDQYRMVAISEGAPDGEVKIKWTADREFEKDEMFCLTIRGDLPNGLQWKDLNQTVLPVTIQNDDEIQPIYVRWERGEEGGDSLSVPEGDPIDLSRLRASTLASQRRSTTHPAGHPRRNRKNNNSHTMGG